MIDVAMLSLNQLVIVLAPTAVALLILIGVLVYIAIKRTDTDEYRRLADRVRHLEANHIADMAQISRAKEEILYIGRLITMLANMVEQSDMMLPPEVANYLHEMRAVSVRSDFAVLLQHALIERFSLAELESLAFDLSIDLEELGGDTKNQKIIQMLRYMDRRRRLNELAERVAQLRPGALPWYNAREPP